MTTRSGQPPTDPTPTYWAAAATASYIPAAEYVARMRTASQPVDGSVSRCSACGQWTWGGVCPLHPEARQDHY